MSPQQQTDEKKQWQKLKKGHTHVAPDAAAGSACLHRYLGQGYTGALVVTRLSDGVVFNRPGDAGESLVVLDAAGAVVREVALPPNHLAWRVVTTHGRTFASVDHRVFEWSTTLDPLTPVARRPGSFLTAAASCVAWFADGEVVVRDLTTGHDRLRVALEPELYAGHTPQIEGALSPDGATLAVCSKSGAIASYDVASGALVRTVTGDFEMVERLVFVGDALLALENYGGWRLLRVTEQGTSALRTQAAPGSLAASPDGTRLAIATGKRIAVCTAASMQTELELTAEHVVKRCAIAWADDRTLAVRTDYGCASLYRV